VSAEEAEKKTATYSVCPNEHNADKHGKEHPSSPDPRIETVEEICSSSRGNDHRSRELDTRDIIPIMPSRRREITVQEDEEDDGRLRGKPGHSPCNLEK
jgi:hypothetical protein